jgi:hypothetical protein
MSDGPCKLSSFGGRLLSLQDRYRNPVVYLVRYRQVLSHEHGLHTKRNVPIAAKSATAKVYASSLWTMVTIGGGRREVGGSKRRDAEKGGLKMTTMMVITEADA